MNRTLITALKRASCFALLAGTLAGAMPARAQIVIFPPPEFVATATPVFFEGHAAYWYGGRWYYRDRGAWGYYHDEPGYLHDWRGHREPERRFYDEHHRGYYRR